MFAREFLLALVSFHHCLNALCVCVCRELSRRVAAVLQQEDQVLLRAAQCLWLPHAAHIPAHKHCLHRVSSTDDVTVTSHYNRVVVVTLAAR